jgi:hypothetical protein
LRKIKHYGVSRAVLPLLAILDDFAGHKLLERKETRLRKTRAGNASLRSALPLPCPE